MGNRRGGSNPGTVVLRLDSSPNRADEHFLTFVERATSGWWANSNGSIPATAALDVPLVLAFQFSANGTDVVVKHLPHSDPNNHIGVETVTLANTSVDVSYANEIALGGWRINGTDANTGEHGNCTIHELLISNGPLPDAMMLAVYDALRHRW